MERYRTGDLGSGKSGGKGGAVLVYKFGQCHWTSACDVLYHLIHIGVDKKVVADNVGHVIFKMILPLASVTPIIP